MSLIAAEPFAERRASAFLRRVYDVSPAAIRHVGGGVESEVWRVERDGESPLCLKWFHTATDATVVQRSLLMDRLARRGLPFPLLRRTRWGEPAATLDGRTVLLMDWIDGSTIPALCTASAAAAGATLADLHSILAEEPAAGAAPPSWRTASAEEMIGACERLRAAISRLAERTPLDEAIDDALAERVAYLRRVDDLRRGLPDMPLQPLHHDYTRPNLLFRSTDLASVLDLKGVCGFAVWELGKLAFEPTTVATRRDWLDVALAALSAYQTRRPLPSAVAAARTTVLYNLFSLWGVSARYQRDGQATPTGNEDYWLNRHETTCRLVDSLGEVEAAIAGVTSRRGQRDRPARTCL